jgi:hypothetical protein
VSHEEDKYEIRSIKCKGEKKRKTKRNLVGRLAFFGFLSIYRDGYYNL